MLENSSVLPPSADLNWSNILHWNVPRGLGPLGVSSVMSGVQNELIYGCSKAVKAYSVSFFGSGDLNTRFLTQPNTLATTNRSESTQHHRNMLK